MEHRATGRSFHAGLIKPLKPGDCGTGRVPHPWPRKSHLDRSPSLGVLDSKALFSFEEQFSKLRIRVAGADSIELCVLSHQIFPFGGQFRSYSRSLDELEATLFFRVFQPRPDASERLFYSDRRFADRARVANSFEDSESSVTDHCVAEVIFQPNFGFHFEVRVQAVLRAASRFRTSGDARVEQGDRLPVSERAQACRPWNYEQARGDVSESAQSLFLPVQSTLRLVPLRSDRQPPRWS